MLTSKGKFFEITFKERRKAAQVLLSGVENGRGGYYLCEPVVSRTLFITVYNVPIDANLESLENYLLQFKLKVLSSHRNTLRGTEIKTGTSSSSKSQATC